MSANVLGFKIRVISVEHTLFYLLSRDNHRHQTKKKHNHGFSLMFQPWPSPVVDNSNSFYITVLPRLIENEETWAHVAHVSLTVSLLPSPFHLFVIDSCRTLRIPVTLFFKNILKVKKAFYKLCRFCSFYRIQLGKTEKV